MIRFSELEGITNGTLITCSNDGPVSTLLTDSRKATATPGVVFFAIKGEHHDGHQYLRDLYARGLRQFIVEYEHESLSQLKDSNILRVASCVYALQAIAAYHRATLSVPVIGITGSNGKTIIKEWLYQLLADDYKIAKNPGSYNSQLGVPLSIWQLQPHHQLGIFEAGISRPGEMVRLEKVIRPTIGVFTNIGSAHDEGFTNRKAKTLEKLSLFTATETLIYNKDHALIDACVGEKKIPSLTWGLKPGADINIENRNGQYHIWHGDKKLSLVLPFTDPASVENCFHCIAVMLHLGYAPEKIQSRINLLRSVPMRLELKEGINQCQVIDDTYNNDLGGLQISLEFLSNQHQKTKKSLILSDILESGLPDGELAKTIASLISTHRIHRFIGIGKILGAHSPYFPSGSLFYADTNEFLQKFDWDSLQQEAILVKGARSFQFEKIVGRLQRKVHGTVMEIDLGAIVHNLNYFKARLKPTTKLMVMVKAFAYGSGSIEIANVLQYHKADYLGVAYADEGIELRKNNITLPIMVMNPSEESFDAIMQYGLEPEIYSFKILESYLAFLNGRSGTIHLKLDTGMHRLGFEEKDLPALVSAMGNHKNLKVASIFSHLAGADESVHDNFSMTQGQHFTTMADQLSRALGYKPLYHILNSPGILRLPALQLDMVRLGIGLYGINPTPEKFEGMQPVATLKTVISQIKHIRKGETVGYGRRGVAERDMTLATIAIGYADGFSRAFSRGVGEVMINGHLAPVVGNVCMDMTMIDISGIDAREGDDVIIFGKQLPIHRLAEKINTIAYEILTNTSERVKRVFVAESL